MSQELTFSSNDISNPDELHQQVNGACNLLEDIYDSGYYPKLIIERSWSKHNPVIAGDFAEPRAYRWYLQRELEKLVERGATIHVERSREVVSLNDPDLLSKVDEDDWDFTQKKLFLFSPERISLSLNRLRHYTGTSAHQFQRYILLTNYDMHVEVFNSIFPDAVQPERSGVQMPAYHHILPDNKGITLVNIGVGPSNAKTITDHLAVLRPDIMIMVGHCGGLRNHQAIGDFVLATGFMRADSVLDDLLPLNVPIIPNYLLNIYLKKALDEYDMNYRLGTVYTTDNRNWEFSRRRTSAEIHNSRSIAIDMESATVATNGFRYRIPFATLLCVSDKPLHGMPKLSEEAQTFYQNSKEKHLEIVLQAIEISKQQNPEGLPNASIRAANEPLMGGS